MKFNLPFIVFLYLSPVVLLAQQTAVYSDPDRNYKKGVELFDNRNYAAAQQCFDTYLQQTPPSPGNTSTLLTINSEYYKAVCAKELMNPDAENLLLSFVENYQETARTGMAYYHLGNYYFLNKKYKNAIEFFEKTDIGNLSNEEIAVYKFQMGYCYFASKKTEEAKALFAEIRNIRNTYYYPANYYYGYIAYVHQSYDEALLSFQKVEESSDYGKVVPYYICQIYFAQKRFDKLIEYATPLAENYKLKNNAEINYLLGQAYFNKKEYNKAKPYLDYYLQNAAEVRKEDIYQLAFSQYQVKDYTNAINNFQKLAGSKDSLAQNASYNMADCYLQAGQKQNAAAAFMEAAKTNFDPAIQQTSLLCYGKLSYELGHHKAAINTLEEFIRKYPNTIFADEATEVLTDIFLTTHNYKDALKVIESARIQSPKIKQASQKVSYYRGVELYNDRNFDAALQSFNKSLQQPIDLDIQSLCHYWKGEIYYNNQDYKNSITFLNQFLSLSKLAKNLPAEISRGTANYTLGYCYLKQKNFGDALTYFNAAVPLIEADIKKLNAAPGSTLASLLSDAILRSADCYFQLKNYPSAITAYNKVIENKYSGIDYAYFQKGMLLGLQNQWDEKIQTLQIINSRYPGSIYSDDAQFEIANAYLIQEKYPPAIQYFEKITQLGKNNYSRKALLKLGLIYYNTGNKDRSLAYYQQVIRDYPKTAEAGEALTAVKDLYIDQGDPDSYINFLKQVPEANITTSTEDSIIYLAAENKYKKGDCENAAKDFTTYINRFGEGVFATSAYFYRAECLSRIKDYANALKDYEAVAAKSRNIYTEKSLAQASKIAYIYLKDCQKAYPHYLKLLEVAEYKQNINDALKGSIRCGFQLKKYEELLAHCNTMIASEYAQSEDKTEAHYYLGKSYLENNNMDAALGELSKVAEAVSNEMYAESNYLIARINFIKANLEQAETHCFKVINQVPSYENWVVKSFILMADLYAKKGDNFQAKATLQSIVDNYEGETELLLSVKDKLRQLTEEEAKQKLIPADSIKTNSDSLYMDMENNK